jgi:hypothetical protein
MSKIVKSKEGYEIIVDDEDYDEVSKFIWRIRKKDIAIGKFYPYSHHYGRFIKLHRYLLNMTDPTIYIDHVNKNTLDNRRCNLRYSTPQENRRNSGKKIKASSKYKGVVWNKIHKKWLVRIVKEKGKRIFLGYFYNEIDAAKAYNEAAKKYFGEFAHLNEV